MKTIKPTQTATLKECVAQANKAEKAATAAKKDRESCDKALAKVVQESDLYCNNVRRAAKMQLAYCDRSNESADCSRFFFWCTFALTVVNLTILFVR